MPWPGDPRVNMQKGGKAKAYQVQQLLKAVDRWHAERAKKEAKEPPDRPVPRKGAKKRKERK